MDELKLFCPAKINLFLAITGRRADGFHRLVSVASPLDWGDTLTVKRSDEAGFSMTCDDQRVPTDESNLVLKAAMAFRAATQWDGGARFHLAKVVPMGAGLGGGSSDAVGALKALNQLAGEPLDAEQLWAVAAQVGSDCPLFLQSGAVVMRGRGEKVERILGSKRKFLAAERILLIKPDFGVNTAWAYGALATMAPAGYLPEGEAETRLAAWLDSVEWGVRELAYNSMEVAVWRKYLALPVLARRLKEELGETLHMSGSGSACFIALGVGSDLAGIERLVRDSWGEAALFQPVALQA